MDQVASFIREQPATAPATYRAVREALARRPLSGGAETALVGSGSSLHALTAMAPSFAAATGRPVRLAGPVGFAAELAAGGPAPQLTIVLSQSGASRTTIDAASRAIARGAEVLRITAEEESPFAALAPDPILMPIGPEPIGPKTKGYTASLAALAAVADHLGGRPEALPRIEDSEIEAGREAVERLVAPLGEVDYVLVAGAGPHLGTALEASLKISEMSGVPAAGFDTEEALHGRLHGLSDRSLAIFIIGETGEAEPGARACRTMRDLGSRAFVLGPTLGAGVFRPEPAEAGGAPLDPVRAIVPFQWLAWALARSRGRDPAAMRYPGLSARLAIKTDRSVE